MSKKTACTELSTHIVKLDVDVILRNYNKPEFWKKQWLIYKSNLLEIHARIDRIEVKRNVIYMEVFCKQDYLECKKLHKLCWVGIPSEYFVIPIEHSDYSKEKFTKDLINNCLYLLKNIEYFFITEYKEYENARDLTTEYENKLEEIAENFLDSENVSNHDIRKAYIDNFLNTSDIPDYKHEVIKNYQYTVIPYEFLMLAAFFGDKEVYDTQCKLTSKTRKSTKIKLWVDMQKLNTNEFVEEMQERLEGI